MGYLEVAVLKDVYMISVQITSKTLLSSPSYNCNSEKYNFNGRIRTSESPACSYWLVNLVINYGCCPISFQIMKMFKVFFSLCTEGFTFADDILVVDCTPALNLIYCFLCNCYEESHK